MPPEATSVLAVLRAVARPPPFQVPRYARDDGGILSTHDPRPTQHLLLGCLAAPAAALPAEAERCGVARGGGAAGPDGRARRAGGRAARADRRSRGPTPGRRTHRIPLLLPRDAENRLRLRHDR